MFFMLCVFIYIFSLNIFYAIVIFSYQKNSYIRMITTCWFANSTNICIVFYQKKIVFFSSLFYVFLLSFFILLMKKKSFFGFLLFLFLGRISGMGIWELLRYWMKIKNVRWHFIHFLNFFPFFRTLERRKKKRKEKKNWKIRMRKLGFTSSSTHVIFPDLI